MVFDDFDDGNLTGWVADGGSWTSQGNELYQQNAGTVATLYGGPNLQDLTYEAKIKIVSGSIANLVFRYENSGNFYLAGLDSATDRVRLVRVKNSVLRETATASIPIVNNQWYNLKVIIAGETAVVFLDCEPVLSYTDGQMMPGGRIGFRTYDTAARFDDARCYDATALP